jgi:hypothetical protein
VPGPVTPVHPAASKDSYGLFPQLPSGYVKIAIENGHLVRSFTHEKFGDFP